MNRSTRKPQVRRVYRPRMEALEDRTMPATIHWNIDANGFWDDAANWDLHRIPRSDDDVVIDRAAANITVTVRRNDDRAGTLTSTEKLVIAPGAYLRAADQATSVIGGEVVISGGLNLHRGVRLTGDVTWTDTGGLDSGTITFAGTTHLVGSGIKSVYNVTMINEGLFLHEGSGNLQTANFNYSFTNKAGAVYDFQSDGSAYGTYFVNQGTVRKTGGNGTSTIGGQDVYTNRGEFILQGGTIEASSGKLALRMSNPTGGNFTVGAGAVVDLTDGNNTTFRGTYTGSGAGRVELSSGSIQIVNNSPAVFNFAQGTLQWIGGSIGFGMLTNQGYIQASGDLDKGLYSGGGIRNFGHVVQTGLGNIVQNGARIENKPGGVYEIAGDGDLGGHFYNEGLFRKVSGSGVSRTSTPDQYGNRGSFIHQGGTVEVLEGQLALGGGQESSGGTLIAAEGTGIELNGGFDTYLNGTYYLQGEGEIFHTTAFIFPGTQLVLDATEGHFVWYSGVIQGNPFITRGDVEIAGPQGKAMNGHWIVEGHVRHTGGSLYGSRSTLEIAPTGIYDFKGDYTLEDTVGSGQLTLLNRGLVRKSGGVGETVLNNSYTDVDHGTFEVQIGTMTMPRSGTFNTVSMNVAAGTELKINDRLHQGAKTYIGRIEGHGLGHVLLQSTMQTSGSEAAILDFDQGVAIVGNDAYFGGTFIIDGHLTLNSSTYIQWRGGFTNVGTIDLIGTSGLNFYTGGCSFDNQGIVQFLNDSNLTANSGYSYAIEFTNSGIIRKVGGTGTSNIFSEGTSGPFRLTNTGTIEVLTGTLSIASPTFYLPQIIAGKLTGGNWKAGPGATLTMPNAGAITNNQANILLTGPGANFNNIAGINRNEGTLRIDQGKSFNTTGNFTNTGHLDVGTGSIFQVNGALTLTGTSIVHLDVTGSATSGLFGKLKSTGSATLAGILEIGLQGYGPTSGEQYAVMTYAGKTGSFASITGVDPYFSSLVNATSVVLNGQGTPPDLIVQNIQVPASGIVGQPTTIGYTIANLSETPTPGSWDDALYLSRDKFFSPDDKLIGIKQHTGGIDGLGNYSDSLTAALPAAQDGNYFVLVISDVNKQAADSDRSNNTASSMDSLSVSVPALNVSVPVTGTLLVGQTIYYRLDIPGNRPDLLVQLQAAAGSVVELYTAKGRLPSTADFDLANNSFNSASTSVLVSEPGVDTWFIMAIARSGVGSIPFSLTSNLATPVLQDVSPRNIGNNGPVTLSLAGLQLRASDTYELVGSGGQAITAQRVSVIQGRQADLTFDLHGSTVGTYQLRLVRDGQQYHLNTPVTVEAAKVNPLHPVLLTPGSYRSGMILQGAISIRNEGNVDVPVPVVFLYSTNGVRIALTRQEIVAGTSPALTRERVLVGVTNSSHPGIIRPGEEARIPFWFQNGPSGISLGLDYQVADASDPINFALVEPQMRPANTTDARWSQTWPAIRAALGSTWGDYVRFMGKYAELSKDQPSPLPADTQYLIDNYPGTSTGFYFEAQNVVTYASQELYRVSHSNVSGTVLLDGTYPVKGTLVKLIKDDGESAVQTVTDKNGQFRLMNVPQGSYHLVVEGYQLQQSTTVTFNGTNIEGLQLAVKQGAVIGGLVQRSTDAALLKGLAVNLVQGTATIATTYTNDRGEYRFTGLDAGSYQLRAGDGALATIQTSTIQVNDQEVLSHVDLTLPLASVVNGIVSRQGAPLAGAHVLLTNQFGSVSSVITDSNGRYAFNNLMAGDYTVSTVKSGYASVSTEFTIGISQELTLPTLALTTGTSLMVSLENQGHDAVTGNVSLFLNGALVSVLVADSQGNVTFENLAAGQYAVRASATGYQSNAANVTISGAASQNLTITLDPTAVIRGTVTTTLGAPISHMIVTLYSTATIGDLNSYAAITDDAGHYEFAVPYGTYTITVGNNGGIHAQQVVVDAAHLVNIVDQSLGGSTLNGILFQSNGITPATEGNVELRQNGKILATAIVGSNGTYTFRQLEPGTYHLIAESSAGYTGTIPVTIGLNSMSTAPALVTGSSSMQGLILFNGQPISGAQVLLQPVDSDTFGMFAFITVNASGSYQFAGLTTGSYRLRVQADGYVIHEETFSVNGTTVHDVALEVGLTLSGTITAGGLPVKDAQVLVQTAGSKQSWGYAFTDAQGRYSISHLPAGSFNVQVIAENSQTQLLEDITLPLSIPALDIALAPQETTLTGTILDEDGNPVVNASITFHSVEGDFIDSITTDAAGHYQLLRLPAGQYQVQISSLGYHGTQLSLNLAAGIPATLGAQLQTVGTDDDYGIYDAFVDGLDTVVSVPIRAVMWQFEKLALAEHGGEPSRIGMDSGALTVARPSLTPAECPALWAAYREVLQWYKKKEAAFADWREAYDMFELNVRTASSRVGILSTQFAVKVLAYSRMADFEGDFAMSGAAFQFGLPVLQFIQTAANIRNVINRDGKPVWSSMSTYEQLKEIGTSVYSILSAGFAGATNVSNLLNVLQGGDAAAIDSVAGKAMAKMGLAYSAFTIGKTMFDSYKLLDDLIGAIDLGLKDYAKARVYYEAAVEKYLNTECVDPKNPDGPRIKGQLRNLGLAVSMDPNNKLSTGVGQYGAIRNGETINFTINFENLASTNAAAQVVKVSDQLSSQLDWSTLQLTGIGFNLQSFAIPQNNGNYETIVTLPGDPDHPIRITIQFNPATGQLLATMQTIDLLTGEATEDPLAGFLPPNDATGRGQGFISFDIKPQAGLTSGTSLTNKASIIFDNNAAIVTNDAINTIDNEAPQSNVATLPVTTTSTNFTVSWSGQDPHHGAGIVSYNIYVSTNNGPFTLWKDHTADTSAVFAGEKGKKYSFYSTAADGLGFEEEAPAAADVTIEVLANLKPSIDRIVLANGDAQRSRFFQVQVFFNTIVTLDKGAFELYLNGKRFTISGILMSVQDGKSVATLQFLTSTLVKTSLPEGQYKLITRARAIKSPTGGQKMESDHTDSFFRLIGDVNSDGKVDASDLAVFNTAYGKKAGQTGFLWFLDFDGNGKIDAKDKAAFNARMKAKR